MFPVVMEETEEERQVDLQLHSDCEYRRDSCHTDARSNANHINGCNLCESCVVSICRIRKQVKGERMIFSYQGKCMLEGSYLEASVDLSIILGKYFLLLEENFGEDGTKAIFDSILKTAMELKDAEEEQNGSESDL